jgi:mRNA interferase MazF
VVAPSRGSVVLVPFPFSDLSQAKFRPAVVLAAVGKGDWVLCQVTSKAYGDDKAILISENDFESGRLRVDSFARPGELFTAHESLFHGEAGRL